MRPKRKSIGKAFRNLLPKTKSKPTNAFFKFRSELKKILNDEVLYIEVFPHAHSTCKSAKRELFTFLMIFMSEEVAMILSQKQFFSTKSFYKSSPLTTRRTLVRSSAKLGITFF